MKLTIGIYKNLSKYQKNPLANLYMHQTNHQNKVSINKSNKRSKNWSDQIGKEASKIKRSKIVIRKSGRVKKEASNSSESKIPESDQRRVPMRESPKYASKSSQGLKIKEAIKITIL
jgi:hypothetical protein